MFKNSTACIKFKYSFSTIWCVTCGVRQGGVTSAHIFSIYVDHIVNRTAESKHPCMVGVNTVNVKGYADDFVLFAPTAADLKVFIDRIEKLTFDHEPMINVAKTKLVVFKPVGRVLGDNI